MTLTERITKAYEMAGEINDILSINAFKGFVEKVEDGMDEVDALNQSIEEIREKMSNLEEDSYVHSALYIQEGLLLQYLPQDMNEAEVEALVRDSDTLPLNEVEEVIQGTLKFYEENRKVYTKELPLEKIREIVEQLLS